MFKYLLTCTYSDILTLYILISAPENTPLHLAAGLCDVDVVKLLLSNGAEANLRNKDKQTPLEKLEAASQSDKYKLDDINEIKNVFEKWQKGEKVKVTQSIKSQIHKTIEDLAEVKDCVTDMTSQVGSLIETIQKLTDALHATSKELEASEQRVKKYENLIQELAKVVKGPTDYISTSKSINTKLGNLMELTTANYFNMCDSNYYNDQVMYLVLQKVADVFGEKPELLDLLASKLYEDYPPIFVNELVNKVRSNSIDGKRRVYECLLHWKIFVGTYVDKVEPLKAMVRQTGINEAEQLCEDIDSIIKEQEDSAHEKPTGEIEKGLRGLHSS